MLWINLVLVLSVDVLLIVQLETQSKLTYLVSQLIFVSFLLRCAIQFDEYAAYVFAFKIIEINNDKIYLANLFLGLHNSSWFMSILFKKTAMG
jgi:hypothetical protein